MSGFTIAKISRANLFIAYVVLICVGCSEKSQNGSTVPKPVIQKIIIKGNAIFKANASSTLNIKGRFDESFIGNIGFFNQIDLYDLNNNNLNNINIGGSVVYCNISASYVQCRVITNESISVKFLNNRMIPLTDTTTLLVVHPMDGNTTLYEIPKGDTTFIINKIIVIAGDKDQGIGFTITKNPAYNDQQAKEFANKSPRSAQGYAHFSGSNQQAINMINYK